MNALSTAARLPLFGLCVWLSLCVGLAGCAVVPPSLGVSYQNRPDQGALIGSPLHAVPRAGTEWKADKPTFVGLAISGGGSRSANFGMAALVELERLGVLQQVDAISAVSGGGIPATWFAMHGTAPDWQARGREVAGTDYLASWLGKLLNPLDGATRVLTDRDRTDALAEVFDSVLFGGQRPSFAQLGAPGPMRPALYLNATDTTSGGKRFVFSDQAFYDALLSDLSSYPLAWAMAASGAFPGVFNSVTLRRYLEHAGGGAPGAAPSPDSGERRYVHLIDGGASDNMGVETLIELARQHHVRRLDQGVNATDQADHCLIIVVDAHVPNNAVIEGRQSDRRNVVSTVLDLNFLDAIDAMFTSNRDLVLNRLGIHRELPLGRYQIALDAAGQLIEYDVLPYARLGRFSIDHYVYQGARGEQAHDRLKDTHVQAIAYGAAQRPRAKPFQCRAWHVALEDVQGIVAWREDGGQWRPMRPDVPADQPVYAFRAGLDRLNAQVSTNYRLSGPPRCSTELVQRSLYDAARIAVREDKASLDGVCAWFAQHGLPMAQCQAAPEPLVRQDLDLEPIVQPKSPLRLEQAMNRFVQCRREAGSAAAP